MGANEMIEWICGSRRSLRAVAVLVMIPAFGTGSAIAQESIEARLQRLEHGLQQLEDREAIRTILERFFEYQESGDREAYGKLFAKDGEMLLRMGHLTGGPEGIGGPARSDRGNQDAAEPRPEPARHVLSNIHIELDGDTATAVSRWTMLVPLEERNRFRLGGSGTYCDKLIREDGEWKILQRVIYCEIPEGMEPLH